MVRKKLKQIYRQMHFQTLQIVRTNKMTFSTTFSLRFVYGFEYIGVVVALVLIGKIAFSSIKITNT